MFVMESIDDLWDHIAYVVAYAPNKFPYRDFIAAEQQMNLDSAFDQLRQGLKMAYPEPVFSSKRDELNDLLDRSYLAYRNNENIQAVELLNSFQEKIFKTDN